MVRQAQKEGQAKASSPEVARVASRIKKSDAKDFASTKHKGLPEKKKMNEEGYDHYRDNILMKGGDHRSKETKNRSYTPSKPIKGKTAAQKAAKGKSALEIVKKSITDKYGKGAIMNLKKEGTAYGIYRGDGKMKFGQKKKEDKKKEEVKAVPADTMEGMYDIDPKTGKSPVASSVEKGNKKKGDKRLRHFAKLAKKMVGEAYGGKGVSRKAKLASTHPPTAKAAIKNIPTETDRGSGNKANKRAGVIPKPTNPSNVIPEAKVDKGRSDYGKASIRNYRRSGPGHDDPGMFDPSGKRGKTIEKRREEHKARRGVKGAKVPAYKVEEKDTSAMKKFLDDKAKKLEKKRNAQSDAAKNNPAFDSTSPRSRSYAGLQLSGDNRLGKILEALTAKERMKRDAGAIAKKKMRNKEHNKYVNFLDVDEALHPNVAKNDAINKANAMKRAKEREASKPSADVIAARKRQYKGGSDYTTADKKKVIQSYKKEETILETPKGDVGKDRPTKEQDRAARSYGSGYGAKYNAPARKTIHKMKRGVKKYKGEKENNDGSTKMTNFIDDRKSHFHRQGKSYAEPSRKKVKEEVAISEKIKYDKKGSSMDYFLGKDPKKTEYYKKNAKKKNESKSSCECKHESFAKFLEEGNATGRMLQKSKTQVTGHISADRGSDEKKNQSKRKGLEKDLKKHKIGHKKGVGEYKYDSGETGREVSYQTSKPDKMSKRRFGKVMRRLGRKHGQESVITKDKDKPAKLHTTEKGSKEKSQTLGKSKAGKHPKGYGETSGTKVRSAKLPKKTNKSSYHYG